ncbi:MAG: hypothetical protein ABSG95_10070 [Solirubrobacteraceae bacterium]|jgi:hypothetical protein
MPPEQPDLYDTPTQPVQAQQTAAYEPIDRDDEWRQEPAELPRRPHRRLLTPIPLALLGVLLAACGFIGGVLVEKGQGSSSSSSAGSAASLASRLRGLAGTSSSSTSASGASGSSSGFTRPTAGTVAYLSGSTLYVTNSEGNTIKIGTSAGTTVTKTVKSTLTGIHPGETVTITGATASNGTVSAESISVGSSGSGLASLFGRSGSRSSGAGSAGSKSSEPTLFGSGG